MTADILITRFYIPGPRDNHIPRPALLGKLQGAWNHDLTLVSAPAGFGKSTLVGAWARKQDRTVCWLSLDEQDNELRRFLRHLEHALDALGETAGGRRAPPPPDASAGGELLLIDLLNRLAGAPAPFALVLDDYHLITAAEIQDAMRFLLDHLPAQMHLVISSRADPPWPLGRLRARGCLLEIRGSDLRFSLRETGEFLEKTVGSEFSPEDIAALDRRTEGWAAGLQLAALSMQKQPDRDSFIRSFTGSHRFLMDYLLEEILDQQPPERRRFLLQTSVLDRLTAPLCDTVTQMPGSQHVLADLEAANLFIQPLDDRRRWFRYHHLFSDLLRNQLSVEYPPDIIAELHRKAGDWFEENELYSDSVRHALAIDDIERIVRVTEKMALYALNIDEFDMLIRWLDRLPEETFIRYPWLFVMRTLAFSKLTYDQSIDEELARLDTLLTHAGINHETAARVRGQAATVRSYLAELREDTLTAIRTAAEALDLLQGSDPRLRAYVLVRLANSLAWSGKIGEAVEAYREAGTIAKRVGDGQSAIIAWSEGAVMQMFAGSANWAFEEIKEVQNFAGTLTERAGRRLPGIGVLYRQMSNILREMNRLADAERFASDSIRVCRQWGEREALMFAKLASGRVLFAQRKFAESEEQFRQMRAIAARISKKTSDYAELWVLRHQLLRGDTAQADRWAAEEGLSSEDEFSYVQRYRYLVFAMYLFAEGDFRGSAGVCEKLGRNAAAAGDRYSRIQSRVLQALALDRMNRQEASFDCFRTALERAREGGYFRVIIDEGQEVEGLLRRAIARGVEPEFAGVLLAALQVPPEINGGHPAGAIMLSERELQVLRLLQTTLSAPEIAAELIIAPSTVRSHIKRIYSELEVHNRREAVRRAKELRLL